jgi:iron complex transport system ATP-binding protein
MTAILQARSITISAGAKRLLDDISLEFERGGTVALVGPNGAGKSTLLRVLAGDLTPGSGRVALKGNDLASLPSHRLALHRAVLSQSISVAFPFTVAEVVRMGAAHARGTDIRKLVGDTLEELDLTDLADRTITTLSGGEQQRAHLARVLVQLAYGRQFEGGDILLLDEPTASLDLRHQLGMMDAVRRRTGDGMLVIAIFHDLNLAALFAERVVVLNRGRVDSDGRPTETLTGNMLRRVFDVETVVGETPPPGMPFLLPQTIVQLSRKESQPASRIAARALPKA